LDLFLTDFAEMKWLEELEELEEAKRAREPNVKLVACGAPEVHDLGAIDVSDTTVP
jgi:hypothetical protein